MLIAGRKVLFDNEVYQARPWAAEYGDYAGLLDGVPEYLHYMMGGVHFFVNILE